MLSGVIDLSTMETEHLRELYDEIREQRDLMQSNADSLDRECMIFENELEKRDYPATLFGD